MTQKEDVAKRMLALTNSIAGSKKRHDSLITDLAKSIKHNPTREALAESLSRRLKKKEGLIFSTGVYGKLTGNIPVESEMASFAKVLQEYDLALACNYHKLPDSEVAAALFIIIHRDIIKAIDYKDEIEKIMGAKESKPLALLVHSFIKLSEYIGDEITIDRIVDGCSLLKDDEVYCMTMNVFMLNSIDPRDLAKKLEESGVYVCPLLKPEDKTVPKVYREFESLVGLLISKTNAGIEWGKENIDSVLRVCQTAEEPMLKIPQNILKQ